MGGHHKECSRRYKERLVNGKKICNVCDKPKELDQYSNKQSYCKECSNRLNKEKYKKSKYKLW